jgi:hypothetical protein
MKRIVTILIVFCLYNINAFGQKKYEMVVEKTDGTETVFNVEDIKRTYFREREVAEEEEDNSPQGVEAVDLGLPSGIKWASADIGATKAGMKGKLYMWENSSEAVAAWGKIWDMPTKDDFAELNSKCRKGKVTINGIGGWKFTGPNGNSIFLPYENNYRGEFWTSTFSPVYNTEIIALYIQEHKGTSFVSRNPSNSTAYIRPVIGHKESDDEPQSSDLDEHKLTGKWICYKQEINDYGTYYERDYSSKNFYISLQTNHKGVLLSGGTFEDIFEKNTFGKEKLFIWSTSGNKIVANFGTYTDDWEVVSMTDDELTLRWVGGEHGEYIIIGKFKKNNESSTDTSNSYISCHDGNHPHYIDLGLPSGTKWACCNEGASAPEDFGGYYTFGQVSSAPTLEQIQELLKNTTYTWTSQNGVNGGKFTGSNGGSVFLPAAGDVWLGGLNGVGSWGYYWSSTPYVEGIGCGLGFGSENAGWNYFSRRSYGLSVRPVR